MSEIIDITLSLVALTILEIVLGVDNLVFLAIISQRLPKYRQAKARQVGLTLAWVARLILLISAIWLTKLTQPLFTFFSYSISGRDIFLILGGMFLLAKSTQEIHTEIEPISKNSSTQIKHANFNMVIAQIAILDVVFSLDSVLTAIGLTQHFWLMAISITIAIICMMFASEPLSYFIEKHPTIKILALSFLMLIGTVLVADGFHFYVPRGYIYFAMGFSLFVETLNLLSRKRRMKVD